jgi:hypothetical protein
MTKEEKAVIKQARRYAKARAEWLCNYSKPPSRGWEDEDNRLAGKMNQTKEELLLAAITLEVMEA